MLPPSPHLQKTLETEKRDAVPNSTHTQVPAGQRQGRMAALCEEKRTGRSTKRMGANQRGTPWGN